MWLMLLEGARMGFDKSEVSIGLLNAAAVSGSGDRSGPDGVAFTPDCGGYG
jgi:hypothetical protein